MPFVTRVTVWGWLLLAVVVCPETLNAAGWKAGVARVNITPSRPMWMSGYASRKHPAEEKLQDLWAKALVLEDPRGEKVVLITLDLVAISRNVSREVCQALHERHRLPRACIALCASHTHSGPVTAGSLDSMYALDETQQQLVADYTADLTNKLVAVTDEAIKGLAPAEVAWQNGQAGFAVNRRNNPEPKVPELREKNLLKGPVDHEVPVLSIRRPDGKLAGVVFGYACHATVLSGYGWCGDYPGFAQAALEERHPGAVALFFAGCGADQNPLPRRTVELARKYGTELADAVDAVLGKKMLAIDGELQAVYQEIPLPFGELPTREQIEANAKSTNRYEVNRARMLLAQLESGKPLSATYPYPVQVWQLGPDLQWVTLGGEVVVDYSIRLKKELGPAHTWVAGYSNDVMAYIPSLRVLKEGGYEGGGSMVYYGLPAPWGKTVEEDIVNAAHQLSKQVHPTGK